MLSSRRFEGNIPKRATKLSAGYDLSAEVEVSILPNTVVSIPTETTIYMLDDEFFDIRPRSGFSTKRKLLLVNSPGTVDADFKKPVSIVLWNFGTETQHIKKGERIAQGIFQKYYKTNDDRSDGERIGGFGSTGKEELK